MIDFDSKINIDNCYCLYCNSLCEIKSWAMKDFVSQNLKCASCKEFFESTYENDTLVTFLFTCNKLQVTYFPENSLFAIKKKSNGKSKSINKILIPAFDCNFKNKNLLFQKLNTYLLF